MPKWKTKWGVICASQSDSCEPEADVGNNNKDKLLINREIEREGDKEEEGKQGERRKERAKEKGITGQWEPRYEWLQNGRERLRNMNAHIHSNTPPGSNAWRTPMSGFFSILFCCKKVPSHHLMVKPRFKSIWNPWRKTQSGWARVSFKSRFGSQLCHFTSCPVLLMWFVFSRSVSSSLKSS